MPALEFRRGVPGDAIALTEFAARVFREAFAADNEPADLEAYIAEAFTVDRQRSELEDERGVVILAGERADGGRSAGDVLAGYAHLVAGAMAADAGGARVLELKRFYVAPPWQGRGVADALMDEVLRAARERDAKLLWLGVWERNHRAIAFYRRHGFTRVGEHTFMLGADAQTDHIMARPVETGADSLRGASPPPASDRGAVGCEPPPR